jgi:tetratricopeptide (TPR) repeat protein
MPVCRARLFVATMMAMLFAIVPHAAERPWTEIRGRNVIVFGQQPPRTLRGIAIQVEQFRAVVGRLIRGARQTQSIPTEVYLFDNDRVMQPYLPLYQGRPAALTGYCHCGASDEISVIVASLANYAESSSIVYHEYAHLLIRNAVRDLPVWLNEGLAEYFSTFTLRTDGREAHIGAPIPRHVAALHDEFLPLAQVVDVDRSSPLYNERTRKSIFYAESWALTHLLLAGRPGGAETLNAFLADYLEGADSSAALTRATGVPLRELEAELRRYINRPTFNAVTITLTDRVEVEAPDAARALAPADADARLGEIQLRVDRVDEAVRRIEAAAASAPNVAQAQLVLARLRLRQSRNADAIVLLRKSTALAPDDFGAQYLYGLTLLRGEGELGDGWPSDRARVARDALTRAVALRPDSAAALAWLGYADQQLGQHLDEARLVTTKAIQLAPGRLDYVLQLAEIDLDAGELDEARRLLTPLTKASDAADAHHASQLLAAVNRRTVPAAPPAVAPWRQPLDLRSVTYRLRELKEGEQRVFGELVEIACAPAGVRFRLRVDGQEQAASARRFEDVTLTSFGDSGDQTVRCGPRQPPDKVYVTRNAEGMVVAVEFMPSGYVP